MHILVSVFAANRLRMCTGYVHMTSVCHIFRVHFIQLCLVPLITCFMFSMTHSSTTTTIHVFIKPFNPGYTHRSYNPGLPIYNVTKMARKPANYQTLKYGSRNILIWLTGDLSCNSGQKYRPTGFQGLTGELLHTRPGPSSLSFESAGTELSETKCSTH